MRGIKLWANIMVMSFVFFNFAGFVAATMPNKAEQEKYYVEDICGKLKIRRGEKPAPDKNQWKWDYSRLCALADAYMKKNK